MPDFSTLNFAEIDFDAHFQSDLWRGVAEEICRREKISFDQIIRAPSSDHVVFLIDKRFVLKIYRPARRCFERETKALEMISARSVSFLHVPEIVGTGAFENLRYAVFTQTGGISVTRADWLKFPENEQFAFIEKLAAALRELHRLSVPGFGEPWPEFVAGRAATFIERQIAHGVNERILAALPAFLEENLPLVPLDDESVFMHADVHFGNLRLARDAHGAWKIAGIFDFADSRCGFHEYEFLAVGVLMIQGQARLQRAFFKAYGYAESDLDEAFRRRLMMLTMLYETADLRRYAMRLKPEAVDFSLDELERGIWSFVK